MLKTQGLHHTPTTIKIDTTKYIISSLLAAVNASPDLLQQGDNGFQVSFHLCAGLLIARKHQAISKQRNKGKNVTGKTS